MDTKLQVRIDADKKEEFTKLAKSNRGKYMLTERSRKEIISRRKRRNNRLSYPFEGPQNSLWVFFHYALK